MKKLFKSLESKGFFRITSSFYGCKAGEVFHFVHSRKNRHGGREVSVIVWYPGFLEDGESFDPKYINSPVEGRVCPTGINGFGAWRSEATSLSPIEKIILEFFKNFRTLADVRSILDGEHVHETYSLVLSSEEGEDAGVPDLPPPLYDVRGGAVDQEVAKKLARDFLSRLLDGLGFQPVPGSDVVMVRPRGDLMDCVRVFLDQFGTFASIACFPWSKVVWSADRRWKGVYYPFGSRLLESDDELWLAPTRSLSDLDISGIRGLVEMDLSRISSIDTLQKFADSLGIEWASLHETLLRVIAKKKEG